MTGGNAWSVTAFAGPWGTCLVDTLYQGSVCLPDAPPVGTRVLSTVNGPPRMYLGKAASSVSYLTVTLADGSTLRVVAVRIGDQKFFAFALGAGQTARHWTARDAAGRPVASGGF